METMSLLFSGTILLLTITFIVIYFKNNKETKKYKKYGFILFINLFIVEIISYIFLGFPNFFVLIESIVLFLKITLFVCVGMYFCSRLEINDLPLIKKLIGDSEQESKIPWKKYLLESFLVISISVAYSFLLFKTTCPTLSENAKNLLDVKSNAEALALQNKNVLSIILIGILAAFNEEIIFRLSIQNFFAHIFKLKGNKYFIAIVISSLIWSLGHIGLIEPGWVKFAQVFPFGIALGFLFKKSGIEVCILCHCFLNILLSIFNPMY